MEIYIRKFNKILQFCQSCLLKLVLAKTCRHFCQIFQPYLVPVAFKDVIRPFSFINHTKEPKNAAKRTFLLQISRPNLAGNFISGCDGFNSCFAKTEIKTSGLSNRTYIKSFYLCFPSEKCVNFGFKKLEIILGG